VVPGFIILMGLLLWLDVSRVRDDPGMIMFSSVYQPGEGSFSGSFQNRSRPRTLSSTFSSMFDLS